MVYLPGNIVAKDLKMDNISIALAPCSERMASYHFHQIYEFTTQPVSSGWLGGKVKSVLE
jgi:hypothetical protein